MHILERLWKHREVHYHILQEIFVLLDSVSLKNVRCCSRSVKEFVDNAVWKNTRCRRRLRTRLNLNWLHRGIVRESAFQCSDNPFDIKIRGDTILCGLRNGTIELWDKHTLERKLSLIEQIGSVQVDATEDIVVGVSSEATVVFWNRHNGIFIDVLYHHRASIWGLSIQGHLVITGSMDGTISVIDINTREVKKHFLAHEDPWGVSDLDTTEDVIVSGCFGKLIHVWDLKNNCSLIRTIQAKHPVSCLSVCSVDRTIASCSRTGKKEHNAPNLIIWSLDSGDALKEIDLPSANFVQIDPCKLIVMTSTGSAVMGEHHMIKWPLAKIMVYILPNGSGSQSRFKRWNPNSHKSEMLLRYRQTPAIASDESVLIFSQSRTPGICSVVDHWPSS